VHGYIDVMDVNGDIVDVKDGGDEAVGCANYRV
jgi:hypothetical protein